MRLAGKIISAFVSVSVLPLLLMSVLLYLYVNSNSEDFYVRQSHTALTAFRAHFDENLLRLEQDATELTLNSDFLVDALDLQKRGGELTGLLESHFARNEFQFAVVRMLQPPGQFKAFQDGLGPYVTAYQPGPAVGAGSSSSGVVRLSDQHAGSLAIVAIVPIVFRDEVAGELVVGTMLTTLVDRFSLGSADLAALLVSSHGQGLFASSQDSLLRANLGQIAAVVNTDSIWQANLRDQEYFVRQSDLIDLNGQPVATLRYIFDQSDFVAGRSRLLRVFLALAAAAIALALLLGYFFQRALSRPIAEMADSARKIASGDVPERIHYFADDEIGDLVSGINRLSDDLRDVEIRLRAAEQVAAWQMFARQTAHEIRNFLMPLATTAAQLERWAQNDQVDRERTLEAARNIQIEILRMKNLLTAFSDFAKLPAPTFRKVQLQQLIAMVRDVFSEQLESGLIHLESNGAAATFSCDPEQLLQVLVNLIKNSFEAGASAIELKFHSTERKLHFEVCDDGAGIDKSRGIDPFTPLFTTKERGSGLGLAICRRIIVDHGGDITFAANPTRGTTFRFYLPLEGV